MYTYILNYYLGKYLNSKKCINSLKLRVLSLLLKYDDFFCVYDKYSGKGKGTKKCRKIAKMNVFEYLILYSALWLTNSKKCKLILCITLLLLWFYVLLLSFIMGLFVRKRWINSLSVREHFQAFVWSKVRKCTHFILSTFVGRKICISILYLFYCS